MSLPAHLEDLNDWEKKLGDPFVDDSVLSFNRSLVLDENSELPKDCIDELKSMGYYEYLVPDKWNGKLHSYQHLYHLIRSLARRDVTVATMYVLQAIGNWAVLICGTEEQKAYYCQKILENEGVTWSVSEREFGTDLLNNQSTALKLDDQYLLNGEKWPIGMCSNLRFTMFLARTGEQGAADSFSLFCVDREMHSSAQYQNLDGEALFGVRGLDLSGVRLTNCPVKDDQIIGSKGNGLEVMLRTQQLNRIGACALSTGAFDSALRVTMGFAEERKLFDQKLSTIPITQLQLTDAFCDLMISELVMNCATRSLHFYPKMTFLWGAIAKYYVPEVIGKGFSELADIIGARYYMRTNFASGVFQKAWRDASLAAFADGNKKVNLKNVAMHMEVCLPVFEKQQGLSEEEQVEIREFFDLFTDVPDAAYEDLSVFSGKRDYVTLHLQDVMDELPDLLSSSLVSDETVFAIRNLGARILDDFKMLASEVALHKNRLQKSYNYSPESFLMAQKYSALHAAAVVISTACYTNFQSPLDTLEWVPACLSRIRRQIDPNRNYPTEADRNSIYTIMEKLYNEDMAFTPIPLLYNGENSSYRDKSFLYI